MLAFMILLPNFVNLSKCLPKSLFRKLSWNHLNLTLQKILLLINWIFTIQIESLLLLTNRVGNITLSEYHKIESAQIQKTNCHKSKLQ